MTKFKTTPPKRTRKAIIASALLSAFVFTATGCDTAFPPPNQQVTAPATLAEDNRVYALVADDATARALADSARALSYTPRAPIDLDGLSLVMVPVDLPEGIAGLDAINALEAAIPDSTVGVNHAYRLQQTTVVANAAPVDPRNYANSLLSWPVGGCRAQTAIGLIDGGIDPTAPGLQGITLRRQSIAQGSPASIRHGTEVASVLSDPSRINSVTLYSANVIATNAAGEDLGGAAQIVQALDWVARQNVGVVNISLAGPRNKLLAQAIENVQSQGIVIVAAVGNNGPSAPAQHPAALDGVVAVTALDAQRRIFPAAVRGDHVDFAAPGVDIFVNSNSGGRFVTGTSMAAPFVTAYIATQAGRAPDGLTMAVQDLGLRGRDSVFGNGLLQAIPDC